MTWIADSTQTRSRLITASASVKEPPLVVSFLSKRKKSTGRIAMMVHCQNHVIQTAIDQKGYHIPGGEASAG
jgi:hypothetical protein